MDDVQEVFQFPLFEFLCHFCLRQKPGFSQFRLRSIFYFAKYAFGATAIPWPEIFEELLRL
jgi:hypothetical protein